MKRFVHVTITNSMVQSIIASLWAIAFAIPIAAQETPSPNRLSPELVALEPLLDPSTWLIVRLDTTRIALPLELQSPPTSQLSPFLAQAARTWHQIKQTTRGRPVYLTLAMPRQFGRYSFQVIFPGTKKSWKPLAAKFPQWNLTADEVASFTVLRPRHFRPSRLAEDNLSSTLVPLDEAWQSVSGYPIQCAIALPAFAKRTLSELVPELPQSIGGGSSRWLSHDLQWIALGIDPKGVRVRLVIQCEKPEQVEKVRAGLMRVAARLQAAIPALKRSNAISKLAVAAAGTMEAKTVRSQWILQTRLDQTDAEAARVFDDTVRNILTRTSLNVVVKRLQALGLGALNFHQANGHFPHPKSHRNNDGKPMLSWRVYLLPYIGELELYREFRLDEPWDSSHNKQFISRMPAVFKSPRADVKPGYTTYLAVAGHDTVLGDSKIVRLKDVLDGTSMTVMIVEVEASRGVVWTAPDDFVPTKGDPTKGLRRSSDGTMALLFTDGSVRWLAPTAYDAKQWWALFHRSDQTVIGPPKE